MSQPAIRRSWRSEDSEVETIRTVSESISFHRGLGESGRRHQLVEHECPACFYDRMFRFVRVNPEHRDHVEYWCTNPSCRHYVSGTYSYVRGFRADAPTVWQQTAYCPDCSERHTVQIDSRRYPPGEVDRFFEDDYRHEALCETCRTNRAEKEAGV